MEQIWHNIFYNSLRISPEEANVFLTEKPMNPKSNRKKTTQVMFETFHTPATYLALQSVLAVYSNGQTNGVSVDIGCDGYSLPHSILKLDLGGRNVTHYLQKIIDDKNYGFKSTYKIDTVVDIKEKLAYVVEDFDKEMLKMETNASEIEKNYELPDGHVITVMEERFRCPEVLFNPSLIGVKHVVLID